MRSLVLVVALVAEPAGQAAMPTFDASDPVASFRAMGEYLARDGGRWRAENPNHDAANPRSPTHFGLWFDRALGGALLELRIVEHLPGEDRISTKATWAWHPNRRELLYTAVDWRGGMAEGVTTFEDARTFVTVTTENRPNGDTWVHRDDNVIVNADVHRNTSRRQDDDGNWVDGGEYIWERVRPVAE